MGPTGPSGPPGPQGPLGPPGPPGTGLTDAPSDGQLYARQNATWAVVTSGGGSGPAPVPPANVTAPAVTGTASVGQTLTCSQGAWSGSPTVFTYQWMRDGANIPGETAPTHLLVSGDSGHSITCLVTASNVNGSTPALSNAIIPTTPPLPANTVSPQVTPLGTASVGTVLSCSQGTWINSPTSYAYQWQRGGTNISGATASSYTVASADAANSISCTVTATSASGSGTAASNSISVQPLPPTNTALPTIVGTPTVHLTVSCTQGTWLGSPTTYTYQWLRDGTVISGATASSYALVTADGTHTVSCAVTAYNSGGSTTATSSGVSVSPPFTLPSGASAIYSLRQVGPGYVTNKCVRVQRFSDNTQQDIGFDANGNLDMTAAAAFAGGSMLYVMTWYDQSGNGRDATQAAMVSAPQLFNVNGPQIGFAALNSLSTAAPITLTGDQTIGIFCQVNSCATGIPVECWDASHGWAIYLNGNGSGSVSTIFDGSANVIKDTSHLLAGSVHQVVLTRGSGTGHIYVDGVQTATGATSNAASTSPVYIGSHQQNQFQFQGMLSEVYLYPTALSSTTVASINTNEVATFPQTGFQNYYNGAHAVQPGAANFLLFGDVLKFEYTQPWTMYAALQMFSIGGNAEGGIGANIDHNLGPVFKGWLVSALLNYGGAPPGAICVRLIHDLSANQHLMMTGLKSIADGQQHLVAVTYDGSGHPAGVKVYIDGVADTLATVSDTLGGLSIVGGAGTQNFSVGGQANDGGNMINGRVGFFQMDNIVRSQSYIQTNFTMSVQPPNTANTLIRLLMTEGSGTTVHDTSSNAFTGTLTSAGMWVP